MQGVLSVAVSLGFVFTISFLLLSCVSCRRFLAKRKLRSKQKKERKVSVPEIKIDLENVEKEKQTNGIPNPVYQDAEAAKAESCAHSEKGGSDTKDDDMAELNGNVKQKTESTENLTEIVSGVENKAFEERNQPEGAETSEKTVSEEPRSDTGLDEAHSQKHETYDDDIEQPKSDDEVFVSKENVGVPEKDGRIPATKLFEPPSEAELEAYNDVVFQGEWRRPVALRHLLEIGLIDKNTADEAVSEAEEARNKMQSEGYYEEEEVPQKLRKFLCGEEPVAGIIVAESGEKKSIYKSAKEGILRRGTAISLLEAQAATGNIIDPVTGRKMSVKEAGQLGLLDRVYETVLLRAERAVSGYKFRASDHVLSLYEAMQKGLVVESHGLRLLEAQCATGGVIDHRINVRVPLDVAIERGLLDERLKEKLEDDEGDETKTFFDPNTEENVTYKELMKRSVLDHDTGLRLYPLEKIMKKRISYGSYSGRSSLASSRTVSRTNSRENIPAALASP